MSADTINVQTEMLEHLSLCQLTFDLHTAIDAYKSEIIVSFMCLIFDTYIHSIKHVNVCICVHDHEYSLPIALQLEIVRSNTRALKVKLRLILNETRMLQPFASVLSTSTARIIVMSWTFVWRNGADFWVNICDSCRVVVLELVWLEKKLHPKYDNYT